MTDYAAEVLADNPVTYWRLDEGAGSGTVADSSGNGHGGTNTGLGVTLGADGIVPCADGKAATFASTSSGITGTDSTPLGATFTVEAWVRPTGIKPSASAMVAGRYLVSPATSRMFELWVQSVDNTPSFITYNSIGSSRAAVTGDPLTVGEVYYLAGTYSHGATILYVNGIAVAGASSTDDAMTTGTPPFTVGARNIVTTDGFVGDIDEVAYYDTALSDERILAHYTAGVACLNGPVVRLYPRDDGRGMSSGPRIWPPAKGRSRIIGGYQ